MNLITYVPMVFSIALYGLFFIQAITYELTTKEIKSVVFVPSVIFGVVFGAILFIIKLSATYSSGISYFNILYGSILFFLLSYIVWAPLSIRRLDTLAFKKLHEKYGLDKAGFKRITPWNKNRVLDTQRDS